MSASSSFNYLRRSFGNSTAGMNRVWTLVGSCVVGAALVDPIFNKRAKVRTLTREWKEATALRRKAYGMDPIRDRRV